MAWGLKARRVILPECTPDNLACTLPSVRGSTLVCARVCVCVCARVSKSLSILTLSLPHKPIRPDPEGGSIPVRASRNKTSFTEDEAASTLPSESKLVWVIEGERSDHHPQGR